MSPPQNVWLVTGASSGLGAAIAISALLAGHKVIACARNPAKAAQEVPEVEAMGGQWLELDVSKKETQQIVYKAIEKIGRIDVVANNAGYILLGAMEDLRYTRDTRSTAYTNNPKLTLPPHLTAKKKSTTK